MFTQHSKYASGVGRWLGAVVGLIGLIALPAQAAGPYSWIQLVPGGKSAEGLYTARAVARVIVEQEALACADKVTIRLPNGAAELATTTRAKPKQGKFSGITVCEAVIPAAHTSGSAEVRVDGELSATLPLPDLSRGIPLEQIIDIGDTGCRNNEDQPDCDPKSDWPFPTLMDRVVDDYTGDGKSPPLVMHTGDFRLYQPTEEDIWKSGKGGWSPEFFEPAANLLPKAHWIFVRGNHESCRETGEAGPGWLYFFDYELKKRRFCDDLPGGKHGTEAGFLEPFAMDAVPAGDPDAGTIRLVFVDSAHRIRNKSVYSKKGKIKDEAGYATAMRFKEKYVDRLNKIAPLLKDDLPVWIVTHMPLFVVTKEYSDKKYELPLPRDALFDSKLVKGDPAPIAKIPVVLSGHLHRAQLVDPRVKETTVAEVKRPLEYVIGISGVNMSGKESDLQWSKVDASWTRLPKSAKKRWRVINEKWHIQRRKEFGFLEARVTPQSVGGYQAKFHVVFYDIANDEWLTDSFVDCVIDGASPYQLNCPER